MPGFRAHYFFGDESEKAFEKTPEFILKHRNVYNLGQQGPDIFFYSPQAHLFYPKNIGFVMHSMRVMSFFQNLFLSREGFLNKEDLEIVDAYICGFMGHYSLDTVAHPYIHDRAEKIKYRKEFSKSFGIPLATLRNWEQGRRDMDATAEAYLKAISKFPNEIMSAQQ